MFPFLLAAVIVTAIAAWRDLRTGKIPNGLTIGTLILAPVAHVAYALAVQKTTGLDALQEGAFSVGGALVCGAVPALLHRGWGAIGGGDVKLFAAVGALCQTMLGLEIQTHGLFVAVLVAPAYLAYDGKLFTTLKSAMVLLLNPLVPKARRASVSPELTTWFRLGPAVLAGAVLSTLLHGRAP